MKRLSLCSMLFLAGGLGFVLGHRNWQLPPRSGLTSHTGLSIQQIQPLSCLMTTRVDVADIQETTLSGYTGGMKAAILVKGDFLLGVDLSQARLENVDAATKTAQLILPEPTVASPRVDHSRTRVFAITSSGLWQLVPGDEGKPRLINRAYEDAQQTISSAAQNQELTQRARSQASRVLGTFFDLIGWSVQISFEQ